MIQLLCTFAVAAVLAPALFSGLGRRSFGLLALVPAATTIWALSQTGAVFAGEFPLQNVSWVPSLGLEFAFRMDVLSWLMTLIVGGVGTLILIYCWGYFGTAAGHLGRFGGVFVAFAGAMFGLVTTDNTLILYLFWELTTVFSFLLIGHYHDRQPSRMAAMQAIIVTGFGGLAMLGGLIMLGTLPGGSFQLSALVQSALAGTLGQGAAHQAIVWTATVLILLGALTKSAQIPFHFWLPAAMAAPTPVSGYLHAAAMVKAGVYLVARLAPGFASVEVWRPIIVAAGLATMIIGGYRALRQNDLKLLLAFGTVSQLGLIMVLVGFGERAIALAGLAMLVAHAMFKACLFLAVGAIDHEFGTRDLRELSGIARAMPGFAVATIIALASMAGLPPMLGYVGKEAALEALSHEGQWLIFVVIVIGSIFTFGYSLRFGWGALATKPGVEQAQKHRLDARLGVPIGLLALASLATGLMPGLMEYLLGPYAASFPGEDGHLTLWGGFGWPLAATGMVIVGGIALFVFRTPVNHFQARFSIPAADRGYRKITIGLNNFSADFTAAIQSGSLPNYLTVILLTMVGAGALLVAIGKVPGLVAPRSWDSPIQAGIVLLACVAAVLVVRSRRRMKAVLLTAFIGYATSLLFALQGAPDLALTQALVETVTLVVMVLVLRRLPPYFSNRPHASDHVRRIIVGAVVGAAVALLGWVAVSARIHPPVTVHYPEEVFAFGYGRNIVNVTLVDTRAWDTLGEISVLLAAATGVASLIFVRERHRPVELHTVLRSAVKKQQVWGRHTPRAAQAELLVSKFDQPPTPDQPNWQRRGRTWLPGVATLAPVRRSLVFEIGARLVFHPLLIFSLFLLFSGHNNPGGGFAGGVLAGIALVIRYLAGGRFDLALAAKVRPGVLLGLGMTLATTAALTPVLFGGTILQTTVFDFGLPIFGEVHLATALFFDIGVYLIVIGLVLDILNSLGGEIDRQAEAEGEEAPEVPHDAPVSEADEEIDVGADLRAAAKQGSEVTP
ncbi:Na+/H+ antiporter subunit A [Propionimicrobium sp. PCR01-08-3]|uniref:Na+/H+ antiporter subunit A n=1 Tax=Propionimicrobium sp. PCR01-08-3 TaxID=3052086 RepID=UPI00255C9B97|nr:Na+/H+ antiporter subunit A [Propionimicrobium sp. PCR01-08-3]WIY82760.1 Na+/H+ antiporter subunit A [Propionimicrobium sp. PCR01-08-3]